MTSPLPIGQLPRPPGLPLIGHLHRIAADPLDFFSGVSAEHGDLVRLQVGSQQMVLITHPDAIEEVLVTHRSATRKDAITRSLEVVMGQGLITADEAVWRKNRRLIAPTFQLRHLERLVSTMVARAEHGIASVTPGERDINTDLLEMALDIVMRTLFGSEAAETAHVHRLLEEMMWAFHLQIHTFRRLMPGWMPSRARRKLATSADSLRSLVDDIVAERRSGPSSDNDLLDRLLSARDDDGHSMDDAQLRDEAITLLLAGHETSALTLSYTLMLLAQHPDAQERVAAELDDALGDRAPTMADLRALPYAEAVIREAMRLYPPAWAIGRESLSDITVGGVLLPAGTLLLMPQWVVHRDARWFDSPQQFRPERWLDGALADLPRFAYFPFGGGPRTCVGNHFARLESLVLLATWLRHFRINPVPGFEPDLLPSATLRPLNGVRVVLERRQR